MPVSHSFAAPSPAALPASLAEGGRLAANGALDVAYSLDFARPLPYGGGLPAFAAVAREGGGAPLMAVRVNPRSPPRGEAIAALAGASEPGVLLPLACGPAAAPDGTVSWYVVCPSPGGPALWDAPASAAPWSEADAIQQVLRPVAAALHALHSRGVTHRGIRPDNLFRPTPSGAVILGSAWAGPAAALQPAVFEPPYAAVCAPEARGEGTPGDDVYALGVLLLSLILGRVPLAGLSDLEVVERKLEQGCLAALTEGTRLPALTGELLTGMLAADPKHRPPAILLADPAAARGRRVAMRSLRRAGQPLMLEGIAVWHTRMLAFAILRHPAAGLRLLRLGVVDHWLRRVLGDATLAARLEDATRLRDGDGDGGAAMLAMRAIALLDPLAPLCWDGLALRPDGLGAILAALGEAGGGQAARLFELLDAEALAVWALMRPDLTDAARMRHMARTLRALLRERGWTGGLARVCYALNPLLACRSPLLAGQSAVRLTDLPAALEAAASGTTPLPPMPADRELIAFAAARGGSDVAAGLAAVSATTRQEDAALAVLRMLASLQTPGVPLPKVAVWLVACAAPRLELWRGRARRAQKQQALAEAAGSGLLHSVLALFEDGAELQADARDYHAALAAIGQIDAELGVLALDEGEDGTGGRARARQHGQEIAGALMLAVLAVCAVAAAAG